MYLTLSCSTSRLYCVAVTRVEKLYCFLRRVLAKQVTTGKLVVGGRFVQPHGSIALMHISERDGVVRVAPTQSTMVGLYQ